MGGRASCYLARVSSLNREPSGSVDEFVEAQLPRVSLTMNPNRSIQPPPNLRTFKHTRSGMVAAALLLGVLPASSAEFTYRYFRFEPTKAINSNGSIQLAEFTFSHEGTVLNLNNRNTTGTDVVPVTVSSGGQDPAGAEGPGKVIDGMPLVTGDTENHTKWFQGAPFNIANALTFDFGDGTPVTVDSYNFCTGNDSVGFNRTPVSWQVSGSDDGTTWDLLDIRNDVAIINQNYTYQAGFELPAGIPPVVYFFEVLNNDFEGTSSIVFNGDPVTLDWDTQYGDTVTLNDGTTTTEEFESAAKVVTPPSNATTVYTLGVESEGFPLLEKTATVRAVEGGTESYRYVRFKITERRGGGAAGLVQLGEFEFYNGDSAVPANKVPVLTATNVGGSNSGEGSTSNEKVEKLIDGDYATKWLDGNNQPVVFDFGTTLSFDRYLFVTGNDAPDRDAVRWTLEGSDDLTTWDLIENVDFTYPTPLIRGASTREIPFPGASLPPQINSFVGNSATVISGESVTFTYTTSAAASVTLDPGGMVLPATSGTVTVTPTEDTTYTLTAVGGQPANTAVSSLNVTVIADPGVDVIAYDDFTAAGPEIALIGSAGYAVDRLRVTPELASQQGAAWFLKKQSVTSGFEATFGMSLNQENPNGFVSADGLAFVVQNSPSGTTALGTGENGVTQNALNIKFKSFGFEFATASLVEVRSGTEVLASQAVGLTPGAELYGLPGHPYTLGSLSTDPAYQVRVVYVPGDLDVYVDGIAIIQNVDVDIAAIGAADGAGESVFGFTARTGGNIQNSDITDWHVNLGDFTEVVPFGLVKTLFKDTDADGVNDVLDMVWNANEAFDYDVQVSSDLSMDSWNLIASEFGINGQLGFSIDLTNPLLIDPAPETMDPRAFFRIEQID